MQNRLYGVIEDFAYDYDIDVKSYSGRGMFGDSCVALVTDNPASDLAKLAMYAMRTGGIPIDEIEEELIDNHRQDSLGLGGVLYWPEIAFEGGEDEEE